MACHCAVTVAARRSACLFSAKCQQYIKTLDQGLTSLCQPCSALDCECKWHRDGCPAMMHGDDENMDLFCMNWKPPASYDRRKCRHSAPPLAASVCSSALAAQEASKSNFVVPVVEQIASNFADHTTWRLSVCLTHDEGK